MSREIIRKSERYSVGMVVPKINSQGKMVGKGLMRLAHKCFKTKDQADKFAGRSRSKEFVRTGRYLTKIEGDLKVIKGC